MNFILGYSSSLATIWKELRKYILHIQYQYTKAVNSLPKINLELFHQLSILPGSEYSLSGHGSIAQMSENGLD